MMTQRAINLAGAIAIPVLLATLGMAATALVGYGDWRAQGAAVDRRIGGVEQYARDHSTSAKRIEDTVTQMRIDQARFVGSVSARITALESNH